MSKRKEFYIIVSILLIGVTLISCDLAPDYITQQYTAQKNIIQYGAAQNSTAQTSLENQLWVSEKIAQGIYPQSIIDNDGTIFSVYRVGDFTDNEVCYKIKNSTTKLWGPEKLLVEGKFKVLRYHYSEYDNLMRIVNDLPSIFLVPSEGNQEIRLYQFNYTAETWENVLVVPKQNSTAEILRVQIEIDNNEQLHIVWVENNTDTLALYYQKYDFTNQSWSLPLNFEPGFVNFGELMMKIANNDIPIVMARVNNRLSFYKIVGESIEYIVGYTNIEVAYLNTFDVDEADNLHVLNTYKGLYIKYPSGNTYPLPYDNIPRINFFSVKNEKPYFILAPDHYLFNGEEWELVRTINFTSLNSLLWKNRIISHRTSFENGILYCHVERTKYIPEVIAPESEYEYSNENISFTVYDNELSHNATYSLTLNSSIISTGNLISNIPINVTSGLEIGDYNFTLNFEDGYGNSFNNSKIVRIVNKKPIITRDFQQIFVKDEIRTLNWTIIDISVKNPTYSIYINEGLMIANESVVSNKISFDISSLLPGTYQIKVEVNDGLGETVDLISGIMIQPVPTLENGGNNPNDDEQPRNDNANIIYGTLGTIASLIVVGVGIKVFSIKQKNKKSIEIGRDTNNLTGEGKNGK